MQEPEDGCQMAGWAMYGSRRHHCANAARCVVKVDDHRDAYPSCFACRDELIELGVPVQML